MRIIDDIKYDFQDVLLVPKRSSLSSRSEVNLVRKFTFKHSPQTISAFGVIAANMDSVGTFGVAKAMKQHTALSALHKHHSIEDLLSFFSSNPGIESKVFYSIGLSIDDKNKLNSFIKKRGTPPKNICIDVANGYSEKFISYVSEIRNDCPDAVIMAGNCVTPELSEQLIIAGADIVKVGIGSGAMCTTRLISGVGYPQFSSVVETADAVHGLGGHVCSDGGCVMPGDISKAFGAGADFVMLGTMLAGHEECDGVKIIYDSQTKTAYDSDDKVYPIPKEYSKNLTDGTYMVFYGMSSKTAMEKHNGGLASYRASEGRTVLIPYKGPIQQTLQQICGGVNSACTYCGAKTIKELPKRATFIKTNRTHNNSHESNTVGF